MITQRLSLYFYQINATFVCFFCTKLNSNVPSSFGLSFTTVMKLISGASLIFSTALNIGNMSYLDTGYYLENYKIMEKSHLNDNEDCEGEPQSSYDINNNNSNNRHSIIINNNINNNNNGNVINNLDDNDVTYSNSIIQYTYQKILSETMIKNLKSCVSKLSKNTIIN